jgi:ubiquitin carboxyl-terminal hydrolase 8
MSDSSENMENSSLNATDNERKKITILGLSGLVNIGNTCYMNAALQCLSASDLLTVYLIGKNGEGEKAQYKNDLKNGIILDLIKKKKCEIDDVSEQDVRREFKFSLTYMLRKLFVIMWNENCRIKPNSFKQALGEKSKMFVGNHQHDSQECLSFILDKIREETKTDAKIKFVKLNEEQENYLNYYNEYYDKINDKDTMKEEKYNLYKKYVDNKKDNLKLDAHISSLYFWKTYLKNNHSSIIDIFTGLFLTKIECKKCNNTSLKFDPYNILSLSIPFVRPNQQITLMDCLNKYFCNEEKLEGDNKYSCDYCREYTDATMKTELWSSPQRFIIQLKRFTANGMRINVNIDFPLDELDMSDYFCSYVKKTAKYELYGVVVHLGNMHFGHYVAFTKNTINNEWYHYDDANVVFVPKDKIESAIKNGGAYVLFYKKKN